MSEMGGSPGVEQVGVPRVAPVPLHELLDSIRASFGRYVAVTDPLDLSLLTVWAAHTWVCEETYTTPRLILDSTMPGSGKTTVLEHLQRLCRTPLLAASLSSPAMLPRMLQGGIRTLLIDEADRSLDPKHPNTPEFIAQLNSGYKRGATRPVLVPGKGNTWDVLELPTFAPVVMAGNAPALPDDTRSRSIRVLLMPDLHGTVEWSDWEEIESDIALLGVELGHAMEAMREQVRTIRPPLPAACVGRFKEKWNPLARVAAVAGGAWPQLVEELIDRDIAEVEAERAEGLLKVPPVVVLLRDLIEVWPATVHFVATSELIRLLIEFNPDYWGQHSAYGRALTAQRFGRLLVEHLKVHSSKNPQGLRGYFNEQFLLAWRRHGLTAAAPAGGAAI